MTDDQRSGVCPGPEQLAAYIEGRVTAEERVSVQQHLADCEDCREVVADAVRLRDESPRSEVLPFWRRRKTQAIGGGVLALAASLILVVQVRPDLNPFRRETAYEELVAAVGVTRTVEPRLSGGFAYGPLRSPTRGERPQSDAAISAAVSRLEDMLRAERTPENLHALGVAYVVDGRSGAGVRLIEEAIRRGGTRAEFQSDLAAALLARGRVNNHEEDFERAVAASKSALEIAPDLKEARFNLALAYEYLSRRADAHREWRAYVTRFDDAWASEARLYLERQ